MTDSPGPSNGHEPREAADESVRYSRSASWRELLAETAARLATRQGAPADLEARWFIEEASGLNGTAFHLGIDEPAAADAVAQLDAMVARRLGGEPVQYIFGHWPFRSLDLLVDRRVLIPRPETEQVAEVALAVLDEIIAETRRAPQSVDDRSATMVADVDHDNLDGKERRSLPGQTPHQMQPEVVERFDNATTTVVDLGTGSGALAFAIATERPGVDVWAVDVDPDALAVARANLAALGSAGRRVKILEGSWFDELPPELRGRIDLVVSNPPYVGATEDLPAEVVDWEPKGALVGGPVGTEPYAAILDEAPQWLAPHGVVVFEIGESQGDKVVELARSAGFAEVTIHQDLAGRDRIIVGRLRNSPVLRH